MLFDNGQGGIEVFINSDNRIHFTKGVLATVFISSSPVVDGAWHHLVWSKNGSTNAAYLDGSPFDGTWTNQTLVTTTGSTFIGRNAESAAYHFRGPIDEVALYAQPLDANTVRQHYLARSPLTSYADNVALDQPLAHWRLDELPATTLGDVSGNGRNGAYANAPTGGVAGATASSGAVQFNGSNQYASVPFASALHVADSFSVELWFKRSTPLSGGIEVLVDNGTGSVEVWFAADNLLRFSKGATATAYTVTTPFTDTNWHHAVWSKSGALNKVYIDGVVAPGTAVAQTLVASTGATFLGKNSEDNLYPFKGSLDEVALYGGPLSAAAVKRHYDAAPALVSGASVPANAPRVGLEDYWTTHGEELGAGASADVNLAGGNVTVRKALPASRGRGFDTTPVVTWNSQDQVSHGEELAPGGVLGRGWTLGLASLAPGDGVTSFSGVSLEPVRAAGAQLTLRDDDGTPHVFGAPTAGVYAAPAGTYLYLRNVVTTGEAVPSWASDAVYAATRPDRVTFWYAGIDAGDLPAKDGRLLGISDRNGARMLMSYDCVEVDDMTRDVSSLGSAACSAYTPQAGYVARYRLAKVLDAENRELVLTYVDELAGGANRNRDGRLAAIVDHGGTTHQFAYNRVGASFTADARLSTITEAHGTPVARTTTLVQSSSDDTATPWLDESLLVIGVMDPRGSTTQFRYGTRGDETVARVVAITDRADSGGEQAETTFGYGVASGALTGQTTVTDEASNVQTYTADAAGRVIRRVSAEGVRERTDYTSGHRVAATHKVLREDEAKTLVGTTAQLLAETGIAAGTEVVVRSAADQQGTRYVEGADYTVTRSPGVGAIVRTAASAIPSGSTVYVTYVYASSTRTWDPLTGYVLTSREPAPQAVNASGVRIAPTPGELAPATVTTYTNSAFGGRVADVATVTSPRGTATTGDPDDFTTTNAYTGLRLTSVTSPVNAGTGDPADLQTTSYEYYPDGTLKATTEPSGAIRGYSAYDVSGQAQIQHDVVGPGNDPLAADPETVTIHNAMGQPTCVDQKLETGDSASTPLTANACEFASTNKTFSTTSYDQLGRVTGTTSPWRTDRRRATRMTNDANDNVVESREHIGYTPGTTTPTTPDTATPGAATTSTFDRLDREVATQLPANNLATPRPRVRKSSFDDADRLVRAVEPLGALTDERYDYTAWHTYDKDGREVRAMDGNRAVTCTWFDRVGNAVAATEPNALAIDAACPTSVPTDWDTRTEYDRAGNAIAQTGVSDQVSETYYDIEGNQVRSEDPTGVATLTVPAADGGSLQSIAPAHEVCTDLTTCSAKAVQSPTTTTISSTSSDGSTTTTTVGARRAIEGGSSGDYTSTSTQNEVTGASVSTLPKRGSEDELKQFQTTDALGNEAASTITTDAGSFEASATNERIRNEAVAPDGSVLKRVDEASGTEVEYTYDVNGQVSTQTERGVTTAFEYYPDGSKRSETRQPQPSAAQPWSASTPYVVGTCLRAPTANGETYLVTNVEDEGDQLAGGSEPSLWPTSGSESFSSGGFSLMRNLCEDVTYFYYDENGAELSTSRTQGNLDNEWTKWTRRDGVGRVLVYETGSHELANIKSSYVYDRSGKVLSKIHQGVQTTNTWGASGAATGRLLSTAVGVQGQAAAMTASFGYDSAGRLASVVRHGSTKVRSDYRYDPAGNLVRLITCGRPDTTSECINASGVLLSTDVYQDARYDHDADGNLRVAAQQLRQADVTAFAASTTYALGAVVRPTSANGHQYLVVAASGASGAQPVWPTAAEATVVSGGVTFKEHTTTTRYGYNAQGQLVFEDRPDDPRPGVVDYDRVYSYNEHGLIQTVANEDCSSGATAETYSYESGASDEPLQLAEHVVNQFSVASGACASSLSRTDTVEYGGDGTGQDGRVTNIERDPVGATPPVSTELAHAPTGGLVAGSLGDTQIAAGMNSSGEVNEQVIADSTSPRRKLTAYAPDGSRSVVTMSGKTKTTPTIELTAPNGQVIGEYRGLAAGRYFVNDHDGSPVLELGTPGDVIASRTFDGFGAQVVSSGEFTTPLGQVGQLVEPSLGNITPYYDPALRLPLIAGTGSGDESGYMDPSGGGGESSGRAKVTVCSESTSTGKLDVIGPDWVRSKGDISCTGVMKRVEIKVCLHASRYAEGEAEKKWCSHREVKKNKAIVSVTKSKTCTGDMDRMYFWTWFDYSYYGKDFVSSGTLNSSKERKRHCA